MEQLALSRHSPTWGESHRASTASRRQWGLFQPISTKTAASPSPTSQAIVFARPFPSRFRATAVSSGDIAWGGNWFFLIGEHPFDLSLANRAELVAASTAIRSALIASGITGEGGAVIDHIEFFAAPSSPGSSSRNFVLCPGASFDRSPCGTGTSAKMACLLRRRQACSGRCLDPGGNSRHVLRRHDHSGSEWSRTSGNHRTGLGHRRVETALPRQRSLRRRHCVLMK